MTTRSIAAFAAIPVLFSACAYEPREQQEMTLNQALAQLHEGLDYMSQMPPSKQPWGLVPTEATATFAVTRGSSNTLKLALAGGGSLSGASVGNDYGQTAQRVGTVTIKLANVYIKNGVYTRPKPGTPDVWKNKPWSKKLSPAEAEKLQELLQKAG
jgi:hypothetical protein